MNAMDEKAFQTYIEEWRELRIKFEEAEKTITNLKWERNELQSVISNYRAFLAAISDLVCKYNRKRKLGFTDADTNRFMFRLNQVLRHKHVQMRQGRKWLLQKNKEIFNWRIK